MIRKQNDREELIESIASEILSYLEKHPNSADSIDGIARWWLKKQRYEEALSNVHSAIRLLLAKGKMERTVVNKGCVVYSARNPREI